MEYQMSEEKESVLDEAKRIIYGDRENTYGKPSKNLEAIAQMWTTYVNNASVDLYDETGNQINILFQAKDVAIMMVLLKTARLANDIDHRDSVVDICGYAALIERCDE